MGIGVCVIDKKARNVTPDDENPKRIVAPVYLPLRARIEYQRVAALLLPRLIDADMRLLELYASQYAIWRDALEAIDREGLVETNPSGSQTQTVYLTIANQANVRMQSLLAELRMTPKSRPYPSGILQNS